MNLTRDWVVGRLPKRPKNAHKGTFGKALVVAGSENFPGAAYLACAAAYRAGTGLVTLATEPEVKVIVSRKLPEVTFLSQDEVIEKKDQYDALLIGPGLGQKDETERLLKKLLKQNLSKTIIDGDGLNIISRIGEWWKDFSKEAILTPHPKEMSRLTGESVEKIQSDRTDVAQYFAKKWNKVVVLKGANTVVAFPTGEVKISPFVNPTLATAGTGDVLAGTIAGMLAQGLKPYEAAGVGVYIHGLAGELLREKIGNTGSLASDLLPILPLAIRRIQTSNRLN